MSNLEGGFTERTKALISASSLILALLGWAFSLGVTYSDLQSVKGEVDRLRISDQQTVQQVSDVKERLAKLETTAASIDQTLKDIRADLREERRTNP